MNLEIHHVSMEKFSMIIVFYFEIIKVILRCTIKIKNFMCFISQVYNSVGTNICYISYFIHNIVHFVPLKLKEILSSI